jgi:hypothetical protein
MKYQLSYIIYLMLLSVYGIAQREADCIWAGQTALSTINPPYYPCILKFNGDNLNYLDSTCYVGISTGYSPSSYSDKRGNFKFVCNGWRLENSNDEVLAYKLWRDDMPWPSGGDTNEVLLQKGPLFLNDPGDSTKVYLFYGQFKYINMPNTIFTKRDIYFTYAYLDVPSQQLVSKNNIILTDTTSVSDMVATRHANGRDWWIIKPGLNSNTHYLGLLDPTGIEMERITIPELTAREQSNTVSFFNEEGTKYVHFTFQNFKFIQTYDFDRCTGQMSNPQEYDLTDLLRVDDVNTSILSPDGSKMYILRYTYEDTLIYPPGIFQYDFDNGNFTRISARGSLQFLTPNNKEIFVSTRINLPDTSFRFFNRIKYPNLPGLACEFISNTDTIRHAISISTPPNFANFRLGPVDGTICDSLGIDNPVAVEQLWEEQENKFALVFPNPFVTELNLRLQTAPKKPLLLQVHNTVGQLLWQCSITQQTTQIPLTQWSKGLYLLRVVDENGKVRYVEKLVCNE